MPRAKDPSKDVKQFPKPSLHDLIRGPRPLRWPPGRTAFRRHQQDTVAREDLRQVAPPSLRQALIRLKPIRGPPTPAIRYFHLPATGAYPRGNAF